MTRKQGERRGKEGRKAKKRYKRSKKVRKKRFGSEVKKCMKV